MASYEPVIACMAPCTSLVREWYMNLIKLADPVCGGPFSATCALPGEKMDIISKCVITDAHWRRVYGILCVTAV